MIDNKEIILYFIAFYKLTSNKFYSKLTVIWKFEQIYSIIKWRKFFISKNGLNFIKIVGKVF
jgi:hypothetical protein